MLLIQRVKQSLNRIVYFPTINYAAYTQYEDLMKLNKDLKSGVETLPHQDSGFQQAKMEL